MSPSLTLEERSEVQLFVQINCQTINHKSLPEASSGRNSWLDCHKMQTRRTWVRLLVSDKTNLLPELQLHRVHYFLPTRAAAFCVLAVWKACRVDHMKSLSRPSQRTQNAQDWQALANLGATPGKEMCIGRRAKGALFDSCILTVCYCCTCLWEWNSTDRGAK